MGVNRCAMARGFTLMDIMMGIALLGGMISLSYFGLNRMQKTVNTAYVSNSTEVDLNQLVQQLIKLGRSAKSCKKKAVTTNPVGTSIECELESGGPVRYFKATAENSIKFQRWDGAAFVTQQTFGGSKYTVTNFNLCPFDGIVLPATCTIEPAAINTSYHARAVASADLKDRYFRFQIEASDGPNKPVYRVQSAFFVRIPAPDGVDYVTGNK